MFIGQILLFQTKKQNNVHSTLGHTWVGMPSFSGDFHMSHHHLRGCCYHQRLFLTCFLHHFLQKLC